MYKYLLNIIILVALQANLQGQDAYFSQFFNSILYLNPAYVGSAHQPRVSIAYRNQMPGLGSPYVSYFASYDQPVKALQGGLGINIMNDAQGPALNRVSADAMYAYYLALNQEWTIHAGFQVSYVYRSLQRSSLVLPDQYDNNGNPLPSGETLGDMSKGYPDFAVGFVAFSRTMYMGASMHHLAKPNLSFSKSSQNLLPRKLSVHWGMYIPLYERRLGRESLKLNPNIVYLHQGSFMQINYGLDIVYKSVYAGVWMRHNIDFAVNSFILHLGYEHEYFRFGYSHDFNVSSPWSNMQHMGAHELTFLLKLTYQRGPRDRFRTIKSPKI